MTNSEILTMSQALKTEINDQISLCSNLFRSDISGKDLESLVNSTDEKIDELKFYQHVIYIRNQEKTVYKDETITYQSIIRIKEGLLLKKKLQTSLIGDSGNNLVNLSLEAFQKVQEYKKDLTMIYNILETFNNSTFNIQDYS